MSDFDLEYAIQMAGADEDQRRAHAVKIDHAAALLRVTNAAVRAAEDSYRQEHPDAAAVGITTEIHSYVKRPKGFGLYAARLVDRFLADPASLKLNNKELAISVGVMTGARVPATLLTEKLTTWQKGKVDEILKARGIDMNLRKADTVSKIKRALSARLTAQEANSRFEGTIVFTEDTVIVNDKARRIQKGDKGPRIHVGRQWLSVERLKEWLVL